MRDSSPGKSRAEKSSVSLPHLPTLGKNMHIVICKQDILLLVLRFICKMANIKIGKSF